MTTRTEITVTEGDWNTPAKLIIELKLPTTLSYEKQKALNGAIATIRSVYAYYRPNLNEKPKS